MTRHSRVSLVCAGMLCASIPLFAQEGGAPDAAELVVKVYRVTDLVLPTPSHAYQGTQLPAAERGGSFRGLIGSLGGGGGYGGGGGMSGSAGGGGGGFFRIPPDVLAQFGSGGGASGSSQPASGFEANDGASAGPAANSLRFTITDLIRAIKVAIDPDSWSEVGGPGTITPLGGTLIVTHTLPVHKKMEQLLIDLRTEGGTLRTVTVSAQWLLLDREGLERLTAQDKDETSPAARAINSAALSKLPDEQRACQGEVTCFDGQTVHVVSGELHTVVQGTTPVVGEVPAYSPLVNAIQFGVLLQVTPSLQPDSDSVVLDLTSLVNGWDQPEKPLEFPLAHAIDRMHHISHQLATTLRAPLGKPVMAGGITLDAGKENAAEAGPQLYLIVEANVSEPK